MSASCHGSRTGGSQFTQGLRGRPICGGVSKAENANACLIVAKDEKNKIEKILALTGSPEKDGNAPWYHHFLHAVCNTYM